MATDLHIIILAAGIGSRMKANLPKVLCPLAGKPMLRRVVETAQSLKPDHIHIVVSHQADRVQTELSDLTIHWVEQPKPMGTGDAVKQVMPFIQPSSNVLVLCGDVPLISDATLKRLQQAVSSPGLGLIAAHLLDPTGLGRIVRNHDGQVTKIVEERDATASERQIREIYAGILLTSGELLAKWLPQLTHQNAQQEYYLTQLIDFAVADQIPIHSVEAIDAEEILGVNDPWQLVQLERYYQRLQAKRWIMQGVNILDPERFDVRGELTCGKGTIIDANVIFEGKVTIGENCRIEANCYLRDVQLADHVHIKLNSVLEEATVEQQATIGPFARVRPTTYIRAHAKIGNFVEIKNSTIGESSKVNHLSYIGDTLMGNEVNMGAGTITVNYDGANKHQTAIKSGAFVGCGTELIAPITVGEKAYIGAGSTLSKDAPPDALTLARTKQTTVKGWRKPK